MLLEATVNEAEALGYLGYAGQELDADLAARFRRAVDLVQQLKPRGLARAFPVARVERDEQGAGLRVRLEGAAVPLEGRDIAAHLAGAREAVLLAVTLGLESEPLIRRETKRSATGGMLVDACASSLVEGAANALSAQVAARARERGLVAGARFSPGYGDFPLQAQRAFLDVLDAPKRAGITVTPASLLVPAKSITAVVGLFSAEACESGVSAAGAAVPVASSDADLGAPAAPAPAVAPAPKTCETCHLAPSCLLRAQGRTCYGR